MSRRYSTPHRTHVVKTRMNDEEYDDFKERLSTYSMSLGQPSGCPT